MSGRGNARALPARARPALVTLTVLIFLLTLGAAALAQNGGGGPSIALDRTEAARGAAIRVTGRDFDRASDSVVILVNDSAVFRIPKSTSLSTDGSFSAWIYVPDEAPFGTVNITAEDVVTGKRSETINVAVNPLSQRAMVANLDALLNEYLKAVPVNARWYEFVRNASESYRVADDRAGTPLGWGLVGGPSGVYSFAPSMVVAMGPAALVEELWPNGTYLPQWYQGQVLNWLAGMRFDPDPARRALLDGFDYGPLVAKSADGTGGAAGLKGDEPTHYFVGLWPHGPALENGLAAALKPAWDTCGLALDPWPVQAPQVFQVRAGSGAWAETSSHYVRWSEAVGGEWLTGAGVAPAAKEQLADRAARAPLLGDEYYSPPRAEVPASPAAVVKRATGNDPARALAGVLPVTPVVKDGESGELRIGVSEAGARAVAGAELLVVTREDGVGYWFIGLPPGPLTVELTAADASDSLVHLKGAGGSVLSYRLGSLGAGTTATLELVDGVGAPALTVGATSVAAKDTGRRSVGLGGGAETGGVGAWWPYAAGGGGLVVVIGIVAGVVAGKRRRRKRQALRPLPTYEPQPVYLAEPTREPGLSHGAEPLSVPEPATRRPEAPSPVSSAPAAIATTQEPAFASPPAPSAVEPVPATSPAGPWPPTTPEPMPQAPWSPPTPVPQQTPVPAPSAWPTPAPTPVSSQALWPGPVSPPTSPLFSGPAPVEPSEGATFVVPAAGATPVPPVASVSAPPVEPAVHATLGRYEIVGVLGRGGMATVYRARHPGLGQDVAVKVLHSHLAADPTFVGRFQTEARAVAALRHPSIIRVLDFDCVNDTYFIVMEFIEGETLAEYTANLSAEGRRPTGQETLRLFTPLCSALDYAHRQGMIHRDIKPSNILLTKDREPVLTDFGIARILGGTRYTMTGFVVGSAHYMSPEQAQDLTSDPRSDLYSLGVVLFETLTGRVPYEGDTTATVLLKHLTSPVPAARSLNPDLPEGIEEVMARVLAKEPGGRYQTGGQLAAALSAVLGGGGQVPEEAVEPGMGNLTDFTRVEAFEAPGAEAGAEPAETATESEFDEEPFAI